MARDRISDFPVQKEEKKHSIVESGKREACLRLYHYHHRINKNFVISIFSHHLFRLIFSCYTFTALHSRKRKTDNLYKTTLVKPPHCFK